MRRVYYNKLVRDNIEDIIHARGELCEVRTILDNAEFEQELFKKVIEEARALSFSRSRSDFLKEYADLMIVLDTLTNLLEVTEVEIKAAIAENLDEKGGFSKQLYLHWAEDVSYSSNESQQGFHS